MVRKNLVCENLSYSIDNNLLNNNILFNDISFTLAKEKTGFVGNNGVGKTTLIKLLIGELKPTFGTIYKNVNVGYLPQNFIFDQEKTVAEIFGISQKIIALEKINSGIGSVADFDIVGDDWNIIEKVDSVLNQCSLKNLNLSRKVKTLSGGQTTQLFIARLLINNPDFLILDEPTNNLDRESRLALYDIIRNFAGGILVVSHDRQLLLLMDQIFELSTLGLKIYGGNYESYVEQKRIERESLEQDVVDAQKVLIKTKKVIQQSKERHDQRVAAGNRSRRSGGQPKLFLDFFKNRSEKTKSKLEEKTDKQLQIVKEKLVVAKSKIEQKDFLNFELEATSVHSKKKVLEIQDLCFAYPNCKPCIINFNMTIIGAKHIAISGQNGSGKTTLLKIISGQLNPLSGVVKIGVEHCAYLDQFLSVLNLDQTVLENFKCLNPSTQETDCRLRLAAFLFSSDTVTKQVKFLSGGERMRAALVSVLMGDTPAQLILLDEPTNNMDLESIAVIETALKNYKGGLIVVSHDDLFLKNIGIEEKINF